MGEQGPIPHECSAVPLGIGEDGFGARADLTSGTVMEDASSERVDDGRARKAEAGVAEPSRKRRRLAADGVSEEKRRRLGVAISVINLDLEEGVEELKREAHGEEEKDDALAVEGAVRVLFGRERPNKRTTKQLIKKMMKVLQAEVVEEEEHD